MQIETLDQKLILSYSPLTRLAFVAVGLVGMIGWVGYRYSHGMLAGGEIIGIAVGMVILLGVACFIYAPSKFVFDKSTQIVSWQKKRIGSMVQGQANFSEITEVKRVHYQDAETQGWQTLLVIGSKQVPLVDGYIQSDKQSAKLLTEIEQFIGHTSA